MSEPQVARPNGARLAELLGRPTLRARVAPATAFVLQRCPGAGAMGVQLTSASRRFREWAEALTEKDPGWADAQDVFAAVDFLQFQTEAVDLPRWAGDPSPARAFFEWRNAALIDLIERDRLPRLSGLVRCVFYRRLRGNPASSARAVAQWWRSVRQAADAPASP